MTAEVVVELSVYAFVTWVLRLAEWSDSSSGATPTGKDLPVQFE
jgi:hypothetical protein